MKGASYFIVAISVIASGVSAIPHKKHPHGAGAGADATAVTTAVPAVAAATSVAVPVASNVADAAVASTAATADVPAVSGTVTRGPQTEVLFEVNGVPGNQCLTFRNNGMSSLSVFTPRLPYYPIHID